MATFLAFMLSASPLIKDYGVHGQVYPIEEEDPVEHLRRTTQSLTELDLHEVDGRLQKHYVKQLREPTPLTLPTSISYEVHYFNPACRAKHDIKDAAGKIVVSKEAFYNPLDHFCLKEPLLFFAGNDPAQLEWAKSLGEHTKWILISGRPLDLEEQEKRPVYFDQNGFLVQKLKISTVPARVSQEGKLLKIEMLPVEGKICAN
jgi:conjugal transfer pilus assembly protein TraW